MTSAALAEEHVQRLEATVELFARQLAETQEAGVSHAIILPRLMLAFRRAFGEPPPGFVMPTLPVGQ